MGRTVGKVLIRKLGVRRATMVSAYVAWWWMFRELEGRHPKNAEELAEAVGVHRATIYRNQALWRECTGDETPARVVEAAIAAGAVGPAFPRRVLSWAL